MTVAELIHELQQHPPGKEVRVCPRSVISTDDASSLWLCDLDAAEADEVRNEGAYVLIWGGKP